jgi:hypothetical protein
MAVANGDGVPGASRETSGTRAVWTPRNFATLLAPAIGARPQSKCHQRQPHAYMSLAVDGGEPAAIRSGAVES